ncbi:MAG: DUF4286 family protein [Polyangiaceae bacterium]
MTLAYTVRIDTPDDATADEVVTWLKAGHIAAVIEAGALGAEVVLHRSHDSTPAQVEVRYRFENQAAFDAYERDHAPRLRAESLNEFPPSRGLRYSRSVGEIL